MGVHTIESFRGGISQQSNRGYASPFKVGLNLDIRKFQDTISCNQAMQKESGSVVVDLCLARVNCSDGNTYWFGDTGKIYRRTSGGTWSLLATDADGRISGAAEWQGKIYYATATNLKHTPVSSINFSAPTTQSTGLTTGYDHFMVPAAGELFITNKSALASVSSGGVLTLTRFEVTPNHYTSTLDERDGYIVVGTKNFGNENQGYLYMFDPQNTTNTNFLKRFRIPAKGINGIIDSEGIICQVGNGIYYADFANRVPLHKIIAGVIKPYGIITNDALVMMGFSGCAYPGVYSYGRKGQDLPTVLNLEYTLSPDAAGIFTDPFVSAVTDIGAIDMYGDTLLVAWKTASGYGVDALQSTAKANGLYESLEFFLPPELTRPTILDQIKLLIKNLPSSCTLAVKVKIDHATSWSTVYTAAGGTSFTDTTAFEAFFNAKRNCNMCFEIRIELTSNSNNCAEVYRIEDYIQ